MKPLANPASSHPSAPRSFFRLALLASCLLPLLAAPSLHAADVTWSSTGTSTPGGDGNWTGGSTWWDGSSAVSWTASDNATFSAAGNTTVNSAVTVGRITFTNSAANISILGGAGDITLNSGITATNTANTAARTFTISESVALGANQTWTVNNGGATGTANLAVSGIISGSNLGITKAGNGTLTLSGNNTYTGNTTISAGILTLANSAVNNKTVVGNITVSGGTLSWLNDNQIADTASVTMTSGTLDLAKNETVNSISVTGGAIGFGSYFNTINASNFSFTGGQMSAGARQADITLNGPITLGNFTFVWNANTASQKGLAIGGDISVNAGATVNFQGGGSWAASNGKLTFNANRTIDVGAGANMNVGWKIVGSGFGLTKNGSGTLTLNATNTYTGTTTINDGTLVLGNAADTLSTNAVTINGGTLSIGANSDTVGAVTLAGGNITGTTGVLTGSSYALQSGSVSAILGGASVAATKTTAGTVTLSGVNTYTGATTINAGTLSIASITNGGVASALGNSTNAAGNLVLGGGALLYTGSNASTDRNFTLTASTASEINVSNAATTLTMSGTSASTNGSLTKSGSGTLILSGNNGHSGGTTINGGTLMLSGTSPGSATVNSGGIIAVGTSANSVGSLTVAGLTLNSGGGYTWDMSDATGAAGTGWDQIVSSGLLTIGATSGSRFTIGIASSGVPANWDYTNSGQTWDIITYGSLSGFSADKFAFDTSAFAGALTLDSHWALSDTGSALRLTYTYSASTPTWNGASGNWTSGFTPAITSGANATFAGAGGTATNNILSGNLSSVGLLLFSGTGAYTLEADSGSAGYDAASALAVNSGVTNSSTGTQTINLALSFASTQTISSTSGDIVIGGPILGAGGLTKEGSNKLTLSGNNTYSGDTTINAGTLEIGAAGRLGSGTYAENIANSGTLIYSGTTAQTLSGVISGSGALTHNAASTLTLTGNNTFSGDTTINAGTLEIGAAGRLGAGSYAGNIANDGLLIYSGTSAQTLSGNISGSGALTKNTASTLTLTGNNTYAGVTTINAGTIEIGAAGRLGAGSYAGNIANDGLLIYSGTSAQTLSGILSGSGALTHNAASTLTLTGNNTYAGATTINAGTLEIGGTGRLGGGSYAGNIVMTGAFTYNSTADQTLSGQISGAGTLFKFASSTLTLSGSNNRSGTLRMGSNSPSLTAGTVKLGHNNAVGTGAIEWENDGTLELASDGLSIANYNFIYARNSATDSRRRYRLDMAGSNTGTLSGAFDVRHGGLVFDVGTDDTLTVSGNLFNGAGSGGFEKTGTGTLVLTGATNTLNSNIVISAGTLQIGNGGTTGTLNSLAVTNNGALAFNRSDAITVANAISGTGALTQNGTGTLTLTNASNSYSGGTTLNTGTLVIGNAAAAGNGTITQSSGSSLLKFDTTGTVANAMSVYNVSANKTLTLSGGITVNNAVIDVASGETLTISNTINGTGGVTKNGTGTLVLSGNNTYQSATIINSGTLEAAHANALGSNNTVEVNGGTLLVSTDDVLQGKEITLNGTSTTVATLSFNSNYNGTIQKLTLSANSIIDLGPANTVALAFADLAMGLYNTLSIYNWSGTTKWGTTYGTGTDTIFFSNQNTPDYTLANVRFYSGAVGSDSFVGSGFEVMPATTWEGGLTGHYIIPVPEPETWATGILLVLGSSVWMCRKRRIRI